MTNVFFITTNEIAKPSFLLTQSCHDVPYHRATKEYSLIYMVVISSSQHNMNQTNKMVAIFIISCPGSHRDGSCKTMVLNTFALVIL